MSKQKFSLEKIEKSTLLDFILISYYDPDMAKEIWASAEEILFNKGMLERK